MLSGVPNLAFAIGYTNASWTLKCDLTCEYVCRLLNHMDEHGYRQCTPRAARPVGRAGAVHRLHLRLRAARDRQVPASRGRRRPGGCTRTTRATSWPLRRGELEDGALEFSAGPAAVEVAERVAA